MMRLQSVVSFCDKRNYSNIDAWLSKLNHQIEAKLHQRMQEVIQHFVSSDIEAPLKHELVIQRQVLRLQPPLEAARLALATELSERVSAVLDQPQLHRFGEVATSFRDSGGLDVASNNNVQCVDAIETIIGDVLGYVQSWRPCQALWSTDIDGALTQLGDDLAKWERFMAEMKQSRETFSSADGAVKRFGPIHISLERLQVCEQHCHMFQLLQADVSRQHDALHNHIVQKYSLKVMAISGALMEQLAAARWQLEAMRVDADSLKDSGLAALLQSCIGNARSWQSTLDSLKIAERVLNRQRFQFPDNWLFAERVASDFTVIQQLLERRAGQLAAEAESKSIEDSFDDFEITSLNEDRVPSIIGITSTRVLKACSAGRLFAMVAGGAVGGQDASGHPAATRSSSA